MNMNVEVITTGTVCGYEDYHADIFIDNKKVGESHYDKRQRKYVAIVNGSRIYRDSLSGIKRAIEIMIRLGQ